MVSFVSSAPRRGALLVCLLAALTVGGCVKSPTEPTGSAPFSAADLELGSGAAAASGNTLNVTYTGWLYDATQIDDKGAAFDTSGDTPFSFSLGSNTVIAGWNQGLAGMKVGGVRRLTLPPSLAYGAERHGIIPPNATLVFEIRLVSIS